MKARRPVSTVIDYRPPSAGANRTTGAPASATRGGSLPVLTRPNEADQHDREARRLPDQTLVAAAEDLNARKVWDQKDPETRWVLARRAALLREIRRRGLKP